MPESFLTGLDNFFATAGPSRFRSVAYPVCPFLDTLIGMTATAEEALDIGIPKTTVIISPSGSAKSQRATIEYEGQYRLLNHARGKTIDDDDEKSMTDYDSNPVQGGSEDKAVLKRFDGPVARMTWRDRILKVWHSDRDYASANSGGDKVRANQAIRGVYDVEQKDGVAVMALGLEKMLMGTHPSFPTGAPTDTSQTKWDTLYALSYAIDNTNTYLGVNRSQAANAYFRGHKFTGARSPVLEELLIEAVLMNGIIDTGGYCDLVVCGRNLFQKFQKEGDTKGYRMISNDKIPDKLQFGSKLQVLEVGFNGRLVFVLLDPHCPEYDANGNLITRTADGTASGTFSYGHVYGLKTNTWTTIIRGGKNFAKSPWIDKTKANPEGAERADVCTLETEICVVCEVPSHNFAFTRVG